jgi:hypothetical protein
MIYEHETHNVNGQLGGRFCPSQYLISTHTQQISVELYADDVGLYKTSADFNSGSDQSNMTPPTYLMRNLNEIP